MAAFVLLQLLYQAVVSRLLSPAAFGLMAVATLSTQFGKTFADMGLGQALIQKAEVTEEDVRAVFTSSVLMGLSFFGLLWIAAPFVADLMNAPDAVLLIRVMGLVLVFTSCGIASQSLLFRDLRFREQAIREIGSYVVGFLLVGIGLALAGAGVWSLVAARVVGSFMGAVLGYVAARHSLRPLLGWRRLRPLYSFGGRTSGSSLATYFSQNLDTMAVSRYAGAALLGQYSKGYMLTSYPSQLMVRSMARVLFPGFSKLQDDRARLRVAYVESYAIAAVLMLAVCAFMAAASEELVLVLLGDQWAVAATVLPILMLAASLRVISHFTGIIFQALGELNKKLVIDCIGVATLAVFLIFARGQELWAFALALVGAEAARQVGFTVALRGALGMPVAASLAALVPGLWMAGGVSAAVLCGRVMAQQMGASMWATLVVEAAMALIAFVLLMRIPPLRPIRRHGAHRLRQAGLLASSRPLSVVLRWVLGKDATSVGAAATAPGAKNTTDDAALLRRDARPRP